MRHVTRLIAALAIVAGVTAVGMAVLTEGPRIL